MSRVRAPELPQNLKWLNCSGTGSENCSLSLKALRGQIVILDFWTYGCINCQHVIGDLQYLEQKYCDLLTIIGVHTAKFDREQDPDSIQQAIWRYGITHPVLVDRDRQVWDHYAIRAWPTFVVINPQGYIVSQISGEGHRQVLEHLVQQLIQEYEGKTLNYQPPLQRLESPLAFPGKVLVNEQSDSLFIADTGHNRIVITTLDGTIKATIGTTAG